MAMEINSSEMKRVQLFEVAGRIDSNNANELGAEMDKKVDDGKTNLVLDLSNPSPGLGWSLGERDSLTQRGPAGAVLALALVHHLAIGNNLPYGHIARFMAGIAPWLVIEFIPPQDSQAQRLLANRDQAGLHKLSQEAFESAFSGWFQVREARPVADSQRVMYLMQAKG